MDAAAAAAVVTVLLLLLLLCSICLVGFKCVCCLTVDWQGHVICCLQQ
jgi:hypothetical protein